MGLVVPLGSTLVLWWDVSLTCVEGQEKVAELQVFLG